MKSLARLSGTFPNRSVRSAITAVVALLLLGVCAFAQDQNQPPPQPPAQTQAQRAIRVARISLIEGDVNYQRGGSSDDKTTDWFDATVNLPLDEKDQVYSGKNGRAEIQFNGRTLTRVDHDTNLRIVQFNTSTIQLAQSIGTASYHVASLDRRQFQVYDVKSGSIDDPLYFEVDTPTVAITFLKEGQYRVNVRDDGTTEIIVRKGQAEVYNQELGTIPVKSGRRIIVEGRDAGIYQLAKLEDKDNWDRWNDRRDDDLFARLESNRTSQYVPASIPGGYELDRYGEWINTPEYGWVWSPHSVAAGWAPYRAGYWRWYGGWGWTWVSSEPWGWVPYHYGRWNYYRSRWCWTPYINVGIGFWDWSPHLVAFFGWGSGYGSAYNAGYWAGYRDGRGWLGWCPLGWGEYWGGGYYGRSRTIINNTIIVNNTNHIRSLDSLRNYNAPNGVSGMEGRHFAQPRVIVNNVSTPPRGGGRLLADDNPVRGNPGGNGPGGNGPGANGRGGGRQVEITRNEGIRPTQGEIARPLPVERSSPVARALEAPVIARRTPVNEGNAMPTRNGLEGGAPGRIVRDGQTGVERNLPARDGAMPSRNASSDRPVESVNRPERRAPEYRPVERVERPTSTRPASEDRSMPRRDNGNSDGGAVITAPRERNMPRGDSETPRRSETPARTNDRSGMPPRTSERPVERRDTPQRSEPPREYRMPSRGDSGPSRGADRPSMPERSAPARESAPRSERSAPARDSGPSKPERPSGGSERSMPSRKSGS